MSENFHKSCYTSRSTGYKYRTLSTNTGERKRRDSNKDSSFDIKFKELEQEISSRIDTQVKLAQEAREISKDKFNKIEAKINSIIYLQETVTDLRQNLLIASCSLTPMLERLNTIEAAVTESETYTLDSKKSSIRFTDLTFEENEILTSNIT